jgi:hypothetical protein
MAGAAQAKDIPIKNPEYAKTARTVVKAIYDVEWKEALEGPIFSITRETLDDNGVHVSAVYQIWVHEKDKRKDRGIDFTVEIFDGAVSRIKIGCRHCG